jgi:DNA-binding response OmpR family regulator
MTTAAKGKLLIVEDDADLARGLRFNFEKEGFEVSVAAAGDTGLAEIRRGGHRAVILDLTLPAMDGLDVLRRARAAGVTTPVVCLTARGQETDIVMALRLGADDYVTKPFGLAVLLARVDALLRRTASPTKTLRFGKVTVDLTARRVKRVDKVEELTPIETDLLLYLADRRGQAVDRADILRDLWGLGDGETTRSLDNHVARIRRKIEVDAAEPRFLVTVHGMGFRLDMDAGEAPSPKRP